MEKLIKYLRRRILAGAPVQPPLLHSSIFEYIKAIGMQNFN